MSGLATAPSAASRRAVARGRPATSPRPRGRAARAIAGKVAHVVYMVIVSAFLVAPIVVVLAASLTSRAYLTFPPHGLSLKWYGSAFAQGGYVSALVFSLWTAALVACLSALLGYLLALSLGSISTVWRPGARPTPLARAVSWLRVGSASARTVRLLALVPVMLPLIVVAVALLQFFSSIGLVYSPLSIVFGQLVMCLPFGVMMTELGMARVDSSACLAAESLGASRFRVLRTVVLPASSSGIAGAWAFSFVIAFGDSTIALLLQSPGQITAPVDIFNVLYFNPFAPTVAAMAGLLAVITFVCLAIGVAFFERSGDK